MSREIKFRVWNKSLKEMTYTDSGFYLCEEYDTLCFPVYVRCYAEADEVELSQYTGLKDKNGTEIYEGDIVEWRINVSTFGSKCFKETVELKEREVMECDEPYTTLAYNGELKNSAVVGNIYENPEMLNEDRIKNT